MFSEYIAPKSERGRCVKLKFKMRSLPFAVLAPALVSFSALSWGQATPAPTAVVDNASFVSRVAPGAIAAVFGTNLATSSTPVLASTLPLPTDLETTEVTVDNVPAPIFSVSANQVDFQVPIETQPGTATLTVTVNGVVSQALQFAVTPTSPGIDQYYAGQPDTLQAVVQNPNQSINSPSDPIDAGEVAVVYLTGIGDVTDPPADGEAALASPLSHALATYSATISGLDVPVQFLGLSPNFVGLGQANIQVPADFPSGNYPLVITIGGLVSTSANITVSGSSQSPAFLEGVGANQHFGVSYVNNIQLLGNTLYLCGDERIRVFDISAPSSPAYLGAYGLSDLNFRGVFCALNASGNPPILVDWSGPSNSPTVYVYTLSNAQVPTKIAQFTPNGYENLQGASFNNDYAFFNTSSFQYDPSSFAVTGQLGDFFAYDLINPTQPVFAAALPGNTGQPGENDKSVKPYAAVVGPTTAYIAGNTAAGAATLGTGSLNVIDISSPGAMQSVAYVTAPGTATLLAFAVSGNTLLAAGNTTNFSNPGVPDFDFTGDLTLTTMDVSNLQSPSVVATVDTGIQANGVNEVAALGGGLFAVTYAAPDTDNGGPSTMAVVDATDPTKPVIYPWVTAYGINGIAAVGGYLYLANGNGIVTYSIHP